MTERLALGLLLILAACGGPAHLSREQLTDPATCKGCHVDHHREWSGSMHAYASADPVFLAMNRRGQRETGGQLGTFCVSCHAPMAVHEGATTDGLNLEQLPGRLQGVTCYYCHSIDRVEGTHNNPLHLADDFTMRGAFADPVRNDVHLSAASPLIDRDRLESAQLCGACHDITTGHGAAIERTLAEWQASVFSQAETGVTCGQCHLAQSAELKPIAQFKGALARRFHAHTFAGIDRALTAFPETDAQQAATQALLDSTLQSAICVAEVGPAVRVILDNVAAGHAFPSGASQDRRVWAEISAYADGGLIYQSGAIAEGAVERPANDPDLWLLRDCLFDESGAELSMFWNAASYEGNALPAAFTFDPGDPRYYQTHVQARFPRTGSLPAAPDRVTLRLRERPIALEVLDDLIDSGDLDAGVRAAMATQEIGKTLEWTPGTATHFADESGFPTSCITGTNLNFRASTVPAARHTRCSP